MVNQLVGAVIGFTVVTIAFRIAERRRRRVREDSERAEARRRDMS